MIFSQRECTNSSNICFQEMGGTLVFRWIVMAKFLKFVTSSLCGLLLQIDINHVYFHSLSIPHLLSRVAITLSLPPPPPPPHQTLIGVVDLILLFYV